MSNSLHAPTTASAEIIPPAKPRAPKLTPAQDEAAQVANVEKSIDLTLPDEKPASLPTLIDLACESWTPSCPFAAKNNHRNR